MYSIVMKRTFPSDTIAAIVCVMTMLVLCLINFVDILYANKCWWYYFNQTKDTPPLSMLEEAMCLL